MLVTGLCEGVCIAISIYCITQLWFTFTLNSIIWIMPVHSIGDSSITWRYSDMKPATTNLLTGTWIFSDNLLQATAFVWICFTPWARRVLLLSGHAAYSIKWALSIGQCPTAPCECNNFINCLHHCYNFIKMFSTQNLRWVWHWLLCDFFELLN